MSGASIVTQGTGEDKAEFYTVPEVARKVRVSEFTVRRLIWERKLKATLVGCRVRVREKDLEVYLSARTWTPQLCQEETGRPRAGRRKANNAAAPGLPAPTPAAPAPERVSTPTEGPS